MDPIITNHDQLSKIEADTRRFGASLPLDIIPGRSGSGWMVWDDEVRCIFLDFFGEFEPSERSRAATTALDVYHGLRLPYSLRVGFHQSEDVARQTMMDWLGFDNPEGEEPEPNKPQDS